MAYVPFVESNDKPSFLPFWERYASWHSEVQAAGDESNREKLPEHMQAAELTICQRMQELAHDMEPCFLSSR